MKAKEFAITIILMISMGILVKAFHDEFEGLFCVFGEAILSQGRTINE